MGESTMLVGKKRRALTAPVFLAVMFSIALVRGLVGASTSTGRVVIVLTMGSLLALCVAYSVWITRQPAERLEVHPDRIVLWQGHDRGIQLGTTPPILVQRRIVGGGTNRTTVWRLVDSAGAAYRFEGQTMTPLDVAIASIDLTSFHPTEVFQAVQRAGWPAAQRL